MSFATTSTPGGKSYGTQDNSRRTIPADPIVSSMTNVMVGILAERGRGDMTLATTSANTLYGKKTFEKDSAFYHHSTYLLEKLAQAGVQVSIKRFIPADATKAMLRLSLELIATDLPRYERNSDGTIKQRVDSITGISTPVTNGTIRGTRAIIHVGVAQYAEENRAYMKGNVMDDFREGSIAVNNKFLGELTRTDGAKEHTKSRLYPIMDLEVDSEGEWGNNLGLTLEVPTLKQVNPVNSADVIKNKAFGIRASVIEREDRYSSPSILPRLDSDLYTNAFFKSRAVDSVTGANLAFARQMVEAFNRKMTATETPIWGPFGKVHVYETNINEIQQMLCNGYTYTDSDGNDIVIAGEGQYDDDAFDYGRTVDHALSQPLNFGLFNFLTGRDINDVPYFSFDLRDSMLFGGVSINSETVLYASGGSDGLWHFADGSPATLVNLKILDDQYRAFLNTFGRGTDKVKDILRYPITQVIDSGWSLDTKLAHSNILSARPDIHLEVGTQAVAEVGPSPVDLGPVYKTGSVNTESAQSAELLNGWNWQPRLTGSEDEAIATRLRTYFGLIPESVFFGTPVMRVHVFGHSGYSIDDTYEPTMPGSVDRGLAMAVFTGVTNWNKESDYTQGDNRKPRFLKDMSYSYRDEDVADSAWATGLNFLRSHDIIDDFWPGVQTIHPHKDSILSNSKFVLAASKCHYFGMEVWRAVSGENLTDDQFKQALEDEAQRIIGGRFTDDVRVVPEAILTDADKARGYSGYLKFHIGVGSARNKLVYSVHGYTLDQLNEMQGLAPAN